MTIKVVPDNMIGRRPKRSGRKIPNAEEAILTRPTTPVAVHRQMLPNKKEKKKAQRIRLFVPSKS